MATRTKILQSIASTIADYRKGEVPEPDADHVERWIRQFEPDVQVPILSELDHILKSAYINREKVEALLTDLATTDALTGGEHSEFWASAGLLNIQGGGASQRELLDIFDGVLRDEFDSGVEDCAASSGQFVYLDDGVFSGSRARQDLVGWVESSAPESATVHVIVMVLYSGGEWYLSKGVAEAAKRAGKKISLEFWNCIRLENRKFALNNSDVLAPAGLPDDENVQKYARQFAAEGYPVEFRKGNSVGPAELFSSPSGRHLLEQEFLKAGVRIRKVCPNLPAACRPLGFTGLRMLGFGSVVVTYRNCPNNCPLPFWAADPWYPLFPRKTNTESGLFVWE